MSNAFRDYATYGRADVSRARGAAIADVAIGAAACLLAWPFPLARAVFRAVAGSEAGGWGIHVPVILLSMAAVAWLVSALSIGIGRRTVGMYFADLGFETPPKLSAAFGASGLWTLAGLAGLVGVRAPAVHFAEARLRSARMPS